MMLLSVAFNMSANLDNSAVQATGLEKVSFHSSPKERQSQRMFNLLHNSTHLTCWQSNAQNSPSQASTIRELWTFRFSSWIYKRQRNQRSNCQQSLDHLKSKRVPEKHLLLLYWLHKAFDCVDHNKLENSSRDANTRPPYLFPEKSVCRSRSNS